MKKFFFVGTSLYKFRSSTPPPPPGTVDPMCPINDGIEDTEHFFLQCHAYESLRRDLLGTVNEVFQLHNILNLPNQTIVQILLYGDKSFTHDQNRQILESTLKFIHSSEQFL